jgi:hypothetical protein
MVVASCAMAGAAMARVAAVAAARTIVFIGISLCARNRAATGEHASPEFRAALAAI